MSRPRAVQVGDRLPPLALPPLTRSTLALYAGGSGDHVPLHIDSAFAQAAGYPDVFMHGMLGMAYVGRMLTAWIPQEAVRELTVRFTAITYPGESLMVEGWVTEVTPEGQRDCCRVEVMVVNQDGERKLAGHALISLPDSSGADRGDS